MGPQISERGQRRMVSGCLWFRFPVVQTASLRPLKKSVQLGGTFQFAWPQAPHHGLTGVPSSHRWWVSVREGRTMSHPSTCPERPVCGQIASLPTSDDLGFYRATLDARATVTASTIVLHSCPWSV